MKFGKLTWKGAAGFTVALITVTCAVMAHAVANDVTAWGNNAYGQTNVPPELTNVVAISAGGYHSLALTSDGNVVAWGRNNVGQTNVPANVTNVIAIAAGTSNSMVLRSDGTIFAWGDNTYGLTNVPASASNVIAVAAGADHSLALRLDGTVIAWGSSLFGKINVPANLSNVVAIAAGSSQSLALKSDGTLVGWGSVAPPAGISNIAEISCGGLQNWGGHCLALKSNGTVVAWGNNVSGQINVPAGLSNVVAIAAGGAYSLAVKSDGTVTGWGVPTGGVIPPPANLSSVVSVAAGGFHSVALNPIGPPRISIQPADRTVVSGMNATFNLTALGSPRMGYQWLFNGTNIAATTAPSLMVSNAKPANAGSYSVIVTNGYGIAVSSNATLTVITSAPIILAQPLSRSAPAGSNATFSVAATGPVPLTYQWQFNGANLPGATLSALTLTNVQPPSEGWYSAVLSNDYASTVTSNAFLDVVSSLAEALNATNLVWTTSGNALWFVGATNTLDGAAGQSGALTAFGQQSVLQTTAEGPGTISFWWSESTNDSMSFLINGAVQAAISGTWDWHSLTMYLDAGTNTLQWIDKRKGVPGFGTAAWVDEVTYVPSAVPATVSTLSGNQTVEAGTNVTFFASIAGTPPVGCQWQFNGTNIPGQTSASLSLLDVQSTNAGTYTITASNYYGMMTSNVVLIVNPTAPVITIPPVSQTRAIRNHAIFQVTAHGSEPLAYSWKFNGIDFSGNISSSLTLLDLQLSNAGTYQATVSNAYGSNSASAALIVGPAAVIAWGGNDLGQTTVPMGLTGTVYVAAEDNNGMALQADSSLARWGDIGERAPSQLPGVVSFVGAWDWGLGLRGDGTVVSWGANGWGQTDTPTGLNNVVQVSAGGYHGLALKAEGTVVPWGYDQNGLTNLPVGLTNAVAVAAGEQHSLALMLDGTVLAWGANWYGETNVPAGLSNVVAIAGGGNQSLALKADGTVAGWGYNSSGQANVPPGLSNVVAIGGGGEFSLALKADGTPFGWGANYEGQTTIPSGLSNVVAIAPGYSHSVALVTDGSPFVARKLLNRTASSGSTVMFSPGVVGSPPLSFQWQFNGTNLIGATNTLLVLTNIPLSSAGSYRCIATNAFGSVTTPDAKLMVLRSTPQFDLAGLQPSTNGVALRLNGLSGHGPIIIYASTNLTDWQPIFTNPPVTGSLQYFDSAFSTLPIRFYRAVEQ